MAIADTYSKRLKRLFRGSAPDLYTYDKLPQQFKVQVFHIWERAIGDFTPYGGRQSLIEMIERRVAEEHGFFVQDYPQTALVRLTKYFLEDQDVPRNLDVVELSFRGINTGIRGALEKGISAGGLQHPDDAIADLNGRFREHSLGYQFIGGQIVRVDSEMVHAEVVKPALTLLHSPGFSGPEEEFLRAHKHYRAGDHGAAITEANKAFESTMKAICKARKWSYDPSKDTAKQLIQILLDRGLIPSFLSGPFTGLRSVLESAVPTTRNRRGGHGQGPEPVAVPDHLAAYVLHVTAANIVMLVQAHRDK